MEDVAEDGKGSSDTISTRKPETEIYKSPAEQRQPKVMRGNCAQVGIASCCLHATQNHIFVADQRREPLQSTA